MDTSPPGIELLGPHRGSNREEEENVVKRGRGKILCLEQSLCTLKMKTDFENWVADKR